ncbi:hypothetical protein [Bacillus cereus]|uniref:hypothetical protein n=1 Tax=Bacillus cereus TaxID=1396 RepID=UPI000B4BC9EB|nr:hypothetical protein [Bacillus cereus]
MKFVDLNNGAKEVAINEVYSNLNNCLNRKNEIIRINKKVKDVFKSYQSNSIDLAWNFKNGKVSYKEFSPQLNISDLLVNNDEINKLWNELYEVTDGYSELEMKLSSESAKADFILDYIPFLNTSYMIGFINKYDNQFKESIMAESDIKSAFESVLKAKGLKITSYLNQKLNQLRIEINNMIKKEMEYLKSRNYIKKQLEAGLTLNLDFDFDGHLVSQNQKTA